MAKLKQLLDQSTDLPSVARLIVGQHWREMKPEQQQEYQRLFDALIMQTMAERIGSYAGQGFEVSGSRQVDDQDTVVSTLITQPSGGQLYHVDWRVRRGADGRFRLIDVVAEGVSLVVTERSEADALVKRGGIDGLLAEMRRRLSQRSPA